LALRIRRNFECREIKAQNFVGAPALSRSLTRTDHAQPDAVAKPAASEPEPAGGPTNLECSALETLPSRRPADGHSKVVAGHFIRTETIDA
jgi:hypothetical protein